MVIANWVVDELNAHRTAINSSQSRGLKPVSYLARLCSWNSIVNIVQSWYTGTFPTTHQVPSVQGNGTGIPNCVMQYISKTSGGHFQFLSEFIPYKNTLALPYSAAMRILGKLFKVYLSTGHESYSLKRARYIPFNVVDIMKPIRRWYPSPMVYNFLVDYTLKVFSIVQSSMYLVYYNQKVVIVRRYYCELKRCRLRY